MGNAIEDKAIVPAEDETMAMLRIRPAAIFDKCDQITAIECAQGC